MLENAGSRVLGEEQLGSIKVMFADVNRECPGEEAQRWVSVGGTGRVDQSTKRR